MTYAVNLGAVPCYLKVNLHFSIHHQRSVSSQMITLGQYFLPWFWKPICPGAFWVLILQRFHVCEHVVGPPLASFSPGSLAVTMSSSDRAMVLNPGRMLESRGRVSKTQTLAPLEVQERSS